MTTDQRAAYQRTARRVSAWLEGGRLAHWLGLPWRCKFRHDPVEQEHWNGDACAVESRWVECVRCGDFIKHLELR
jgi:hypothetical protein